MRFISLPLLFLIFMLLIALACNFTSENTANSPTSVSTLVSLAAGSPSQCTPDCVTPSSDYVTYNGPQSDCRVDYTRHDPMNIYSQPTEGSTVVGTLGQNQFSFAFAQRNMWYKIYIPETSSYGWVPMGVLDMWTGAPCTTLPVEAMPATDECIVVNTSGENVGLYSSPNDSAFVLRFPAGMSAVGLEQQGEWLKVRLEQGLWPDAGEYWVRAASFRTEGPCNF